MTQGELEQLPQAVGRAFTKLEQNIMMDVVRKIRINGFSSTSADWQLSRLQQLGSSKEEIQGWIQEALEVSDQELQQIFSDQVYQQYAGQQRAFRLMGMQQIPLAENTQLQQMVESIRQQTADTFRNITDSMGFVRQGTSGRLMSLSLTEFYQDTLDQAMYEIHSGAFSYQTVLNRVINEMTRSGIRWIDYASGHHNRIDVAARRAVMTGFRQVQGRINEQTARQMGTDSYEVTWHMGARPTHQSWQGKVWTMQQLQEICGLGSVTGLHGANCYHDYNAFIPVISVRTYTDEWLEEQNRRENTSRNYLGKEYTTYEALQRQRQMEATLRKYRRDIELLKEGGASQRDIMLKQCRYQGKLQEYQAFSKSMGLPVQVERVYQDGLGNVLKPKVARTVDFLIRSYTPGQNITSERMMAIRVISSMPKKVQEKLKDTVINIGKMGASQYDYNHDILYIALGADETEVIHEIGHMAENKLLNKEKVEALKETFIKDVPVQNITEEIYQDASGNLVKIFILKDDRFVSEYQGRLYVDDWSEIFDENWKIKPELLQEFMSEPFREYIQNPERMEREFPIFYQLMKEVIE